MLAWDSRRDLELALHTLRSHFRFIPAHSSPNPTLYNTIPRPLSSSFLGLPYRIRNMNPKKELLRGLWVQSLNPVPVQKPRRDGFCSDRARSKGSSNDLMARVRGPTLFPGSRLSKAWGVLSLLLASIAGCYPAFSARQEPLSWVRQRAGQGLHTSASNHTGELSRQEKMLLSRISIAGERGDWMQVQREFGTYAGQAVPT